MANKPWTKYAVSEPSKKKNWVEPKCQGFNTVSHVSHVAQALHICETGQLREGLVYDESWLNKHRISVVWLSPNDWVDGFRYGNVRFTFDWELLIEDRKYYWVEDMTDYSPQACRILLASKSYDGELAKNLIEYNPEDGEGPWWYDSKKGIHYRNGNVTLEFMVDDSLTLSNCERLDFVKHHKNYCCIDHRSCNDLGMLAYEAGTQFIGKCLARNISPPSKLMNINQNSDVAGNALTSALGDLLKPVYLNIEETGYKKKIAKTSPEAKEIARAMLACFADSSRENEGIALAKLFHSHKSLLKVVQDLAYECFFLRFYPDG